MFFFSFCLAFFAAAPYLFPPRCRCRCRRQADEKNVLVLDESNFEQALAENDVLLLEFFAPWCGNCQRLRPRYARAAAALAGEGSPARLAKVSSFCCFIFSFGALMFRAFPCWCCSVLLLLCLLFG